MKINQMKQKGQTEKTIKWAFPSTEKINQEWNLFFHFH